MLRTYDVTIWRMTGGSIGECEGDGSAQQGGAAGAQQGQGTGSRRGEFADSGFRDAKVDRIAERAGLTRGAVYSNFPGKRGLYFAVLAERAERTERAPAAPRPEPGRTLGEALGALARAWVARLPLADTDEQHGAARLGVYVVPEVLAEERIRRPYAQLMKLDALLLGLALERLGSAPVSGAGAGAGSGATSTGGAWFGSPRPS